MGTSETERIRVEVAYAPDQQVDITRVDLSPGASVRDAIEQSGFMDKYPVIDLHRNKTGVFGRLRALDQPVQAGDRVEIYRPLIIDPKEARRRRASRRREGKK